MDMAQALTAAENPQVLAGSGGHADQQAFGSAKEYTGPAVGGQDRSLDTQEQFATDTVVQNETPEASQRFKSSPEEQNSADDQAPIGYADISVG